MTILGAFVLLQAGALSSRSAVYLAMNFGGSVTLAATALLEAQWGVLILHTAWALVTAVSIARRSGAV